MEEILKKLKQAAIPQTVELDLPDEDELVEIEEQLLLSLPKSLRDYLLNASHLVYGSIEPVTVCDAYAHTHLPEVTAEAWANGLPRDLIPICQTNNDYYCISQEGEVRLWHAGEFSNDYWEDMWQWINDIWLNE